MKTVKLVRAMIAGGFLLGWPQISLGAVIFSTFGPGQTFDLLSCMPANFYTTPEVIGTSLAFAFDVPAGPDHTLSSVSIASSWEGTKQNAVFALYGDAAGVPAASPIETLGTNPPTMENWPTVITMPSTAHPVLTAGARYWLVCEPASLDTSVPANDFLELWMNSQGLAGWQTSRTSFDSAPWTDWYSPAFESAIPAFSVQASPVPEPAGLALILIPTTFVIRRNR